MQIRGYETYLDSVPASSFNAECVERSIAPATVITYSDWLRQSLNPIYYGVSRQYKVITLKFEFQYNRDEDLLKYSGDLTRALEHCQLKFSNIKYYFDCALASASLEKEDGPEEYLSATLNASYAYLPAVSQMLSGQAGTITAQGNLPSPAIVTLTPTQDIGAVALTGLTKRPITVRQLHAGAPVTIDGEKGLITEADLDTVITEDMGAGKWMFRKYSEPSLFSPDTWHGEYTPTKSLIQPGRSYIQKLIADGASLYQGGGDNYLGWLRTALYTASAKSITFQFLHDDGVSVYFNGAAVYSCDTNETNDYYGPGYPSITLNLPIGWSVLEFLWLNHYGADGIWGITPVIGSQIDKLNAYYARDTGLPGAVNKFPDTDMWSFPVLQPGDNPVSIDSAVCNVKIEYKPKFM